MSIDRIFEAVGNARDLGGYTPRLGIGRHKLLLKRYGVKESTKQKGQMIIEADFVVVESTVHSAGEVRGWAWFPNSAGWAGEYEMSRAKAFLAAVGQSIGDTSPVQSIGAALASPAQFGMGLALEVIVSPQTNKDGSPKTNAKGEVYMNAQWLPVKQSLEDIQAARATLEDFTPAPNSDTQAAGQAVAQAAAVAPAATPAAVAPAAGAPTAPAPASLLAALRK